MARLLKKLRLPGKVVSLPALLTKLNPAPLLLRYEGYPPAVLFALVLHGALFYLVLGGGIFGPREAVSVEQVNYINATAVEENPQRRRREQQQEARRQEEARARQAAAAEEAAREEQEEQEARRREEERRQQELAQQLERQQEAARRAQEEAREQARREQARREQEERERERELARQAEQARQAQQQAAQAEQRQQAIAEYTSIIHDAVARNWSIPPSARNDMSVLLEIRLVPTGEVIDARVIESSDDAAFDRSALQAVRKAERFPQLQEMPIALFEREFRTFNLLFRPEDLLR